MKRMVPRPRRAGSNLAPLAGRGRERSERVRGTSQRPSSWRIPLTPTLSPQAGRGSRPSAVTRIERTEMRGGPFSKAPNLASLDPGYVLVRVPDALLRCARDRRRRRHSSGTASEP